MTARCVAAYKATYLSHPHPVIDQVGTNLYSLVNRELASVSSLSEAISQKPNRQASNLEPLNRKIHYKSQLFIRSSV